MKAAVVAFVRMVVRATSLVRRTIHTVSVRGYILVMPVKLVSCYVCVDLGQGVMPPIGFNRSLLT